MPTAKITNKGQITIPVVVRRALGITAGDRVEFVQIKPGHFELVPATLSITALKGLVPKPNIPVGIEQINQAIAKQAAKSK